MKKFLIGITTLFTVFIVSAQDLSLYEKHLYIKDRDTLPYRLLMPVNFDATRKYPLILFLHGAGERGRDNELQLVHGAKLFLREDIRNKYPAIVVFPQCPPESFWSNVDFKQKNGKREFHFNAGSKQTIAMAMVQGMLRSLFAQYKVNRKKIYVMGLSMGGMGTFEIVQRNPNLFAAAVPICGGGDIGAVENMNKVKWWVFHGAKDNVVPPMFSELMVEALRKSKTKVKFTLYPEANHNSWDPAFAEPLLMPWLFSARK